MQMRVKSAWLCFVLSACGAPTLDDFTYKTLTVNPETLEVYVAYEDEGQHKLRSPKATIDGTALALVLSDCDELVHQDHMEGCTLNCRARFALDPSARKSLVSKEVSEVVVSDRGSSIRGRFSNLVVEQRGLRITNPDQTARVGDEVVIVPEPLTDLPHACRRGAYSCRGCEPFSGPLTARFRTDAQDTDATVGIEFEDHRIKFRVPASWPAGCGAIRFDTTIDPDAKLRGSVPIEACSPDTRCNADFFYDEKLVLPLTVAQ